MDIEQTLNSIIFFPSVKNGFYDYSTPLKNIEKFDTDKSNECSQTLFEYLCYKIVKKKVLEGKINPDTVLITDQFLSSYNCKQLFIKTNAIHKKHIVIFLRNQITQKWNLIAFLDLEQQLKNCFDQINKKPITAKIISSSQNSDEDDYILNSTMDKLENKFNFKSPDDIQFEVDSINISDQPNTSIFLLNFIDGLMSKTDDESLLFYIKKLYDEGSNNIDQSSKDYFHSFNNINEEFENICTKYKKELNEYKSINGIKFDGEKIMNGSNQILNVAISNGLAMSECQNGQGEMINGMNTVNLNNENNKMKDDIDMIQIEQDDDLDDELNSEEEEEALKIMERENKVAKSQMREQERKLRQRMYKQKLRLKNINMYKEFGVIKEEDNESESESIDYFSKIKEEEAKTKEAIIDIKKSLRKSMEARKNKNEAKNNGKNNIENIEKNMVVFNTENNINNNIELRKDILNTENSQTELDQKCKSEKRIKLSVLKDLEEAIEEFESEQDPIKPIDGNSSNNNNNIIISSSNSNSNNNSNINSNSNNNNTNLNIEKENKKFEMTNENKETKIENKENKDEGNKDVKENKNKIEKKFSIKSNVEENKKYNKKNSNRNNCIKKESIDLNLMKKSSIPKGKIKEKEQIQENKDKALLINKIIDNNKKSFIGDSKPQEKDKDKKKEKEKEKEKEKTKDKKLDENLNKIIKNNNRNTSKGKNQSNNSVKSNKSINTINSKNSKDQDNNSTSNNSTSNILNKDSFKSYNSSNNSKNMNDSEKSSNKEKEKENVKINLEPSNNTVKKSGNINANNNIKKKNSKNLKKSNSKKSSKEANNYNASIPISSKVTTDSKQTSSSLKSEETIHSFRNSTDNKNLKEMVVKNSKNDKDFIVIESNNGLTPDKLVKKNSNDLKNKERVENGSNKIINLDLNSIHSERYYGDCSSNINIENISSDDFESEGSKYKKNEYNEGGSFYGENRTKKTTYKRGDKKMKIPPGKSRANHTNYNSQFCNYDDEGNSKPCGCIGEQANALCFIF